MEIEFVNLIWNFEIEKWVCEGCGAEYGSKNRIPKPDYCMRCHKGWIKNEGLNEMEV